MSTRKSVSDYLKPVPDRFSRRLSIDPVTLQAFLPKSFKLEPKKLDCVVCEDTGIVTIEVSIYPDRPEHRTRFGARCICGASNGLSVNIPQITIEGFKAIQDKRLAKQYSGVQP